MAVRQITEYFESRQIDIKSSLRAIGCDGTALNTGMWNGIIRRLEVYCNRPLHHFVCLIHMNELPLKALFNRLVGRSNGNGSYRGLLGDLIKRQDLNTGKAANFDIINIDLDKYPFPRFSNDDLKRVANKRNDQMYLYHICWGILTGSLKDNSEWSQSFLRRPLGELSGARWLTTANRTAIVYITTQDPDSIPHLRTIMLFILQCYAPVFFMIKMEPNWTFGPKHFHELARRSRDLPENARLIVDDVLRNNSYFVHKETIVGALLFEDDLALKQQAIDLIKKARSKRAYNCNLIERTKKGQAAVPKLIITNNRKQLRRFQSPGKDVNLGALNWWEMVDIETAPLEPPLVRGIRMKDLSTLQCLKIPCNSQFVELLVKGVSGCSTKCASDEAINGIMHSKKKFTPFRGIKIRSSTLPQLE